MHVHDTTYSKSRSKGLRTEKVCVKGAPHLGELGNVKADTHEGFCSRSMLQAHFARVSTHEGAFSSSLNLLRELSPKYLTG